jgi:hypothetical protein
VKSLVAMGGTLHVIAERLQSGRPQRQLGLARQRSSARVCVSPVSPLKTKSKWHSQRARQYQRRAQGGLTRRSKVRQGNEQSCSIRHEGQVAIAGKENHKAHASILSAGRAQEGCAVFVPDTMRAPAGKRT